MPRVIEVELPDAIVERIGRRAARQLAPESKTKALRLVGLVADGDIPPDASENFRQRLYQTQGEGQ